LVKRIDELQSKGGGSGFGLESVDTIGLPGRRPKQPDLFESLSGSGKVKETPLARLSEEDAKDFGFVWNKVLSTLGEVRPSLKENLAFGQVVQFEDGVLTLGFDRNHSFHRSRVAEESNRQLVEGVLKEKTGSNVRVEVEETSEVRERPVSGKKPEDEIPVVKKAREIFG
jgi:hypothetical protein